MLPPFHGGLNWINDVPRLKPGATRAARFTSETQTPCSHCERNSTPCSFTRQCDSPRMRCQRVAPGFDLGFPTTKTTEAVNTAKASRHLPFRFNLRKMLQVRFNHGPEFQITCHIICTLRPDMIHPNGQCQSIYENSDSDHRTPVPRHREIPSPLVRAICRQRSIPEP